MKNLIYLLSFMLIGFSFTACDSIGDDKDNNKDEIVGTWVSQGATNVALGLRVLSKTRKIDAVFNENGTYNVVSTDSSNATVTFTGTWVATTPAANGIRAIELRQATPTSLVAKGIFQIQAGVMTYEVIQSEPALAGVVGPTQAGGFGSTTIGGTAQGTFWVQKFTKN
jgi:hypothetical protein